MPTPIEIAKGFLDKALAALPEEKRTELQSEYNRTQDLMQSTLQSFVAQEVQTKFDTEKAALEDWRTKLRTWQATTAQTLEERERALREKEGQLTTKPTGTEPPVVPPTAGTIPADVVTKDDLARFTDSFGTAVVGATSEVFRLGQRHAALYGGAEIFDPETLFAHPLAKTQGLSAAFNELHKEKIAAASQQQREAAEKRIRDDERARVIAEFGQNKTLPFPGPGDDDSPFAILAKRQNDNQERFGAEAASEFFNQLRTTRPA
jgi:hypothetical protein